MLKTLFAVVAGAALSGCQPPTTEQAAPPPAVASSASQCYGYLTRDTVYLALRGTGPAVAGTLYYHYAEKDRNQGTIRGAFSGDTLRADYTFQSEGITSVREVAFVKRGTSLVEGYGPVTERGGKTVFRQPHQLKFESAFPLAPVACQGR